MWNSKLRLEKSFVLHVSYKELVPNMYRALLYISHKTYFNAVVSLEKQLFGFTFHLKIIQANQTPQPGRVSGGDHWLTTQQLFQMRFDGSCTWALLVICWLKGDTICNCTDTIWLMFLKVLSSCSAGGESGQVRAEVRRPVGGHPMKDEGSWWQNEWGEVRRSGQIRSVHSRNSGQGWLSTAYQWKQSYWTQHKH